MTSRRVLIVEDERLVAADVEMALAQAGWDVCGIAGSQAEALRLGETTRPAFAVIDVRLSPGDGRVVARELLQRFGTAVLLATAHYDDIADLTRTGAIGCLPKPFHADNVPAALQVIQGIREGRPPRKRPDFMLLLGAPGR